MFNLNQVQSCVEDSKDHLNIVERLPQRDVVTKQEAVFSEGGSCVSIPGVPWERLRGFQWWGCAGHAPRCLAAALSTLICLQMGQIQHQAPWFSHHPGLDVGLRLGGGRGRRRIQQRDDVAILQAVHRAGITYADPVILHPVQAPGTARPCPPLQRQLQTVATAAGPAQLQAAGADSIWATQRQGPFAP